MAGVLVAGNFFQTLAVQPAIGRLFVAEETKKGGRSAVLLSDAFWRRRFRRIQRLWGNRSRSTNRR